MSELFMVATILFGPCATERDRISGLGSLSLAVAASVALQSARTREHAIKATVIVGTLAAVVATSAIGIDDMKGPGGVVARALGARGDSDGGVVINPNTLAYLTLPAPIVAMTLWLYSASRRAAALWLTVALLGVAVLGATNSRSCLTALAVATFVTIGIRFPRARLPATLGAVVLIGAVALGAAGAASMQERYAIWLQVGTVLTDVAPGVIGYGALPYVPSLLTGEPEVASAHNAALQLLADFGPLGTAALAAAAWHSSGVAVYALRGGLHDVASARRDASAVLSSLIALAIVGMAESLVTGQVRLGTVVVTVVSPVPFLVLAGAPPATPPARPA